MEVFDKIFDAIKTLKFFLKKTLKNVKNMAKVKKVKKRFTCMLYMHVMYVYLCGYFLRFI